MKSLKLLMTTVIVGAMALTSAAAYAADKGLVGVLMPNKTSLRWINDGDAVKSQLEASATPSTCSTRRTTSPTSSASSRTRSPRARRL